MDGFNSFRIDGSKSSQEYPINAGVPRVSIPVPTLILLYTSGFPYDVIFNIAIYGLDTTLHAKCDQASDLWQQLEFDLGDTVDWGRRCLVDLMLEELNLFCLTGLITLVLFM